jgi:hypothetical protein
MIAEVRGQIAEVKIQLQYQKFDGRNWIEEVRVQNSRSAAGTLWLPPLQSDL